MKTSKTLNLSASIQKLKYFNNKNNRAIINLKKS